MSKIKRLDECVFRIETFGVTKEFHERVYNAWEIFSQEKEVRIVGQKMFLSKSDCIRSAVAFCRRNNFKWEVVG